MMKRKAMRGIPSYADTMMADPPAGDGGVDIEPGDGGSPSLDMGTTTESDGESGTQDGSTDTGDTSSQETDSPISSEDLLEILNFRAQKAEKARAAQTQGGQSQEGGAPPAQATGSQQAPPASQQATPVVFEPFKMAEEMKEAFAGGDFDGGLNVFGQHLISQVQASREAIEEAAVSRSVDGLVEAFNKEGGALKASMLKEARILGRMDRYLEQPENSDIAGYDEEVHRAAINQADREMPDAPMSKKLERMAALVRDGIRIHKLVEQGKVIDKRPGRKPASDSPRVGGDETQAKQHVKDASNQWDPMVGRLY